MIQNSVEWVQHQSEVMYTLFFHAFNQLHIINTESPPLPQSNYIGVIYITSIAGRNLTTITHFMTLC